MITEEMGNAIVLSASYGFERGDRVSLERLLTRRVIPCHSQPVQSQCFQWPTWVLPIGRNPLVYSLFKTLPQLLTNQRLPVVQY